jgi:hypothetical protein
MLSSSSQFHATDAPEKTRRWKGKRVPRERGRKRERKKNDKKINGIENCGAKFSESF